MVARPRAVMRSTASSMCWARPCSGVGNDGNVSVSHPSALSVHPTSPRPHTSACFLLPNPSGTVALSSASPPLASHSSLISSSVSWTPRGFTRRATGWRCHYVPRPTAGRRMLRPPLRRQQTRYRGTEEAWALCVIDSTMDQSTLMENGLTYGPAL